MNLNFRSNIFYRQLGKVPWATFAEISKIIFRFLFKTIPFQSDFAFLNLKLSMSFHPMIFTAGFPPPGWWMVFSIHANARYQYKIGLHSLVSPGTGFFAFVRSIFPFSYSIQPIRSSIRNGNDIYPTVDRSSRSGRFCRNNTPHHLLPSQL